MQEHDMKRRGRPLSVCSFSILALISHISIHCAKTNWIFAKHNEHVTNAMVYTVFCWNISAQKISHTVHRCICFICGRLGFSRLFMYYFFGTVYALTLFLKSLLETLVYKVYNSLQLCSNWGGWEIQQKTNFQT